MENKKLFNIFFTGLFNRAILQSGHGYCSWAFCPDPFTIGFEIGSLLGYNGNSSNRKELLEFLLKVPATELTRAQLKLSARVSTYLSQQPMSS